MSELVSETNSPAPLKSRWEILKEHINYYHDILKWIVVPMELCGVKKSTVSGPRKDITWGKSLTDGNGPKGRNIKDFCILNGKLYLKIEYNSRISKN